MDEALFNRLCYVFPASGLLDLNVGLRTPTCIYFFQRTPRYPYPRNAFFGVDGDFARYSANKAVHDRVMAVQPVACPVPLSTARAFLSLANCERAHLERRSESKLSDYDNVSVMYSNSVLLTQDESAMKMLGIIGKRANSVTFCSMDDGIVSSVHKQIRAVVAEGMVGLSMIAYYQGNIPQSISYATAALFKHPCALPFVNCVRIVALSKNDIQSVLMFTEMVLLPFYLRSKQANIRKLYETELAIWDRSMLRGLTRLAEQLVVTSQSMATKFNGQFGVMRAKFIDDRFVERICAVCGKGANGEKLRHCGRCLKMYYCGKECQLVDWKRHKQSDCVV